MIIPKSATGLNEYADIVQETGNIDYVSSGNLVTNVAVKNVLVSSSSDLTSLSDYAPGTIAFTAGFTSVWMKSLSDTWVEI